MRYCLRASWTIYLMCMVQPAHMEEARHDPPTSSSTFAHDIVAVAVPAAGGQWALVSCALDRACRGHVPVAHVPSLREAVASMASPAREEGCWSSASGPWTCQKLDPASSAAGSLLLGVRST